MAFNHQVRFVDLDVDEDASLTTKRFRHQASDPNVYSGKALAELLGITQFPTVILVDQNGRQDFRTIKVGSDFESALNTRILFLSVSGPMSPPAATTILQTTFFPIMPVVWLALTGVAFIGSLYLFSQARKRRHTELCYDLDSVKTAGFEKIQVAFSKLANAHALWRITSQSPTHDWKRNAGVNTLINRKSVVCGSLTIPNVSTNLRVIGIDLGDIRLYPLPDFILCWQDHKFSAINYSEFQVSNQRHCFVEDGTVPTDAQIIDRTWRYVNKNGSPDRRFSNNSQIPVVEYGGVTLGLRHGLHVDLRVSSVTASSEFVEILSPQNSKAQSDTPPRSKPVNSPKESAIGNAQKLLGVGASASLEEISAAYRRLAQMYHPDKVANLAVEFQVLAEQRMKEINQAYSLLKAAKQ